MQIENNTIVSLRYVMKNDAGEIMEDNTKTAAFDYVHGSGNLLPALEKAITGLSVGATKTFSITDEQLKGIFHFDVTIDHIRIASEEEITKGYPLKMVDANDCGPGCNC